MKKYLPLIIIAVAGLLAYLYVSKKTTAAYDAGLTDGQVSALGW